MSIKPIINNVNSKENRSLNIYARSVNCALFEADDIKSDFLEVFDNAIINSLDVNTRTNTVDLNATGDVDLKGNIIPSKTTTAGNILSNTDGNGDLQWVAPSILPTIPTVINARINPFSIGYGVTFGSTSTSTGVSDFTYDILYQSIDNRVTVSGLFKYTTGVGGNNKNLILVEVPPVPTNLIKSTTVNIRGSVSGVSGSNLPSTTGIVKYNPVINNIQLEMIVDIALIAVEYDIQWTASYIID